MKSENSNVTMRAWAPGGTLFLLSLLALPALSQPQADPRVAAGVFPPWWEPAEIVAAAGRAGAIIRQGGLPFIVVVRSDSGDAAARLNASGSLFTLNPLGLAGCLARS